MERLNDLKECLVACAEAQMGNLQGVNTEELGEVIDMIKDLEEAMYYHTSRHYPGKTIYPREVEYFNRDMDRGMGRMYYPRYYTETIAGARGGNGGNSSSNSSGGGRGSGRRSFSEGKGNQLKELEKCLNEMVEEVAEMMEDVSPEERQYYERKLSQIATKMNNV